MVVDLYWWPWTAAGGFTRLLCYLEKKEPDYQVLASSAVKKWKRGVNS
jgi:hypothetical protein